MVRRLGHLLQDPRLRNLLVHRIRVRALRDAAPRASGRLLDIGCGLKPYELMFRPYVDEHVGVDHEGTIHDTNNVDLFGTAYELPVDDSSFDTVLCTAVLEHLEEPCAAVREARRVLRDDGIAIYTIPFFWNLHEEPRDFYRYTKYGIQHLFDQAGFDIDELRPLAGFWVTTGQMFSNYIYLFRRGRLSRLTVPLLSLLVQVATGTLDRIHRAEAWTWMYLVVARARPDSA